MCRYVCSVCGELIANNHGSLTHWKWGDPWSPKPQNQGSYAILVPCLHLEIIGENFDYCSRVPNLSYTWYFLQRLNLKQCKYI